MKFLSLLLVFQILLFKAEAQISKGIEALSGGMPKTAKAIFRNQLQNPELKPKALYFLGKVYLEMNQPDSASIYFESGIAEPLNDALCTVGKSELIIKTNPAQAEELIKNVIKDKKYRNDPSLFVAVANAYKADKKFDKAHEYLEKAKNIDQKYTGIYLTEGDVLLEEQPTNAGNAVTKYESAIYFDPACIPAYLKIAKIYVSTGKADLALQYLEKVEQVDPHFPAYLKMKGDICYQKGRYDEAVSLYKEYLLCPEASLDDQIRYSYALFFNRNYDESLKTIKYLIQHTPDNVVLKRLLAYNSFETGDFKDGLSYIKNFFQAAKATETISSDYKYYARILSKNNMDSLSIASYIKAIDLYQGESNDLFKEVAQEYEKVKNYEKASDSWEKYIKASSKPENSELFYWARDSYFAAGAIDSALISKFPEKSETKKICLSRADSLFSVIITNVPDNYIGYLWKARVNALMDPATEQGLAKPFYEQTAILLEKTQKNKSELLEAYQYMGYYYFLKQDNNQSLLYWNKILSIDPNNSTALQAVKGIKQQQ